MGELEQIAIVALQGDPLTLRSLVQDWLRSAAPLADTPRPATGDAAVLAVAAALAELFAQRTGQSAPEWTRAISGLPEPRYLLRSAMTMRHLRQMCYEESPEPLRRRNLYAPANYLLFA